MKEFNIKKRLVRKKRILIALSIILTITQITIISLTIAKLIPYTILLTTPFIILIIRKMGKDVDAIIDTIFLLELSEKGEPFEGIIDTYIEQEEDKNK